MAENGNPFDHFAPYKDADQLHPLVLAYVGDAVYEIYIRQYVVSKANLKPNHLHKTATKYVSAKAQSKAVAALMPLLSEEEADVLRRGRNSKSGSSPKNADILEYRHSTGFECLIGYLYYKQRYERLNEIMDAARTAVEAQG